MPSPTKPSSERKTIAVFASQVGRAWGAEFTAGVNDGAEEHNVNLVHFIGGRLTLISTPDQDKPSHGLYDLAKPGQFDGLLLTADVAYGTSPEELKAFVEFYKGVPIVTQSVDVEGASMFIADNVAGIRAAVRHLIEEHGYKRSAYSHALR